MNDKQQTAVQWLREQLVTPAPAATTEWIFNKALKMEQKQIEEAYNQGYDDSYYQPDTDGQDYYNKTYEQQ